jgi:hypothetical protein
LLVCIGTHEKLALSGVPVQVRRQLRGDNGQITPLGLRQPDLLRLSYSAAAGFSDLAALADWNRLVTSGRFHE